MRKEHWIVALIVVAALVAFGRAADKPKAEPAVRWEYKIEWLAPSSRDGGVVRGDDNSWHSKASRVERELNELGSEGWELVRFLGDDELHAFFRRQSR